MWFCTHYWTIICRGMAISVRSSSCIYSSLPIKPIINFAIRVKSRTIVTSLGTKILWYNCRVAEWNLKSNIQKYAPQLLIFPMKYRLRWFHSSQKYGFHLVDPICIPRLYLIISHLHTWTLHRMNEISYSTYSTTSCTSIGWRDWTISSEFVVKHNKIKFDPS